MNEQVARPGQLTCIDGDCPLGGLFQPPTASTCLSCGGPLGRVPPEPGESVAVGGLPGSRSAPAHGSTPRRLLIAVPIALVVVLVLVIVQNPDALHRITGPEFQPGDCVQVRSRLLDSTMDRTDCRPNRTREDITNPVYRVESVIDGKDGVCPGGFSRITFSNEPEDTTYCLVLN